jgi:hypothetical protein
MAEPLLTEIAQFENVLHIALYLFDKICPRVQGIVLKMIPTEARLIWVSIYFTIYMFCFF